CEKGELLAVDTCVPAPVFVEVQGGLVMLGSPKDEPGREKDEPQREATVASSLFISTTEVTQGQYLAIIGDNPGKACEQPDVGLDHPAGCVSWHEALRFCNRLSEAARLKPAYTVVGGLIVWDRDADGYRLLTETEWELAARSETASILAGGDQPDAVAWWRDNAGGRTHPVGTLRPTTSGLYDMSGNVAEWVWDGYAKDPLKGVGEELDKSSERVQKGGSVLDGWTYLRVAFRDVDRADLAHPTVGFRIARNGTSAPEQAP
ncbi:MAG: sulfatase modifying factor 1, partial [Kiritimatiellia bacterium]